MKELPVPTGIWATGRNRPALAIPFTASKSVPSPPTSTIGDSPRPAASAARSVTWPGRSDTAVW